jgi:hypothetical protein
VFMFMFILLFELLFEWLFQDEILSFGLLVWNNLSSSVSLVELMTGWLVAGGVDVNIMIYVKGGKFCCLLVFEIIIMSIDIVDASDL